MEKKQNLNIFNNMTKRINEIKKALFKAIMEIDKHYYVSENIIYAENAFLINSILSWYLKEREEEEINIIQISSFLDLLEKHVQGEVILKWDESGNIQMKKANQQGVCETGKP